MFLAVILVRIFGAPFSGAVTAHGTRLQDIPLSVQSTLPTMSSIFMQAPTLCNPGKVIISLGAIRICNSPPLTKGTSFWAKATTICELGEARKVWLTHSALFFCADRHQNCIVKRTRNQRRRGRFSPRRRGLQDQTHVCLGVYLSVQPYYLLSLDLLYPRWVWHTRRSNANHLDHLQSFCLLAKLQCQIDAQRATA